MMRPKRANERRYNVMSHTLDTDADKRRSLYPVAQNERQEGDNRNSARSGDRTCSYLVTGQNYGYEDALPASDRVSNDGLYHNGGMKPVAGTRHN